MTACKVVRYGRPEERQVPLRIARQRLAKTSQCEQRALLLQKNRYESGSKSQYRSETGSESVSGSDTDSDQFPD